MPSSGPSMDVDALAYINAQQTIDGVVISAADKSAINALFVSLKSNSNPYGQGKALYLYFGNTILNALNPVNSNAAFRATAPNGATINSLGCTLNGTNQYLQTNLNQLANIPVNSESHSWYNGIDANTGCDVGLYVGGGGSAIFSRNSGNFLLRLQQSSDNNIGANATAIGRYVASVRSQDLGGGFYGRRVLKNGVQFYSNSATSPVGVLNANYTIGAYNTSGTPGGYRNARYGYFWIGKELSNTQMSELDSAFSTFITATSRA
jgi:hypothetical protein